MNNITSILTILLIFCCATKGKSDTLNPVKDLAVVANDYKAEAKKVKKELVADIIKGVDVDVATKSYELKKESLLKKFKTKRMDEYKPTRIVEKKSSFQAERKPVYQGQPRKTSHSSAKYEAPEHMLFDKIDTNPQTEIGNTKNSYSVSIDKKFVTVDISARSRYATQGKSHIIVEPIVTWKYDLSSIVTKDAEKLKSLLFK